MMGDTLIPPSPNWFLSQAVDARSEDGMLITASFKSLVVYQVSQEAALPKVIKLIYSPEKIVLVRIYPKANHTTYGKSVGLSGDGPAVKLFNFESGEVVKHHEEHQNATVSGLSWGQLGEEPALVSVDSKSRMVVWLVGEELTKVHKYSHIVNELSCVEVDPSDPGRAVVGGGKTLIVVGLKDGNVLMQFHGHNSEIYCMRWFQGGGSPFCDSVDNVQTSKSQEATSSSEKGTNGPRGSDRDNWRNSPTAPNSDGPFLVSSDYARQIFVWDLSAKRYVAEVTVPQSGSGYYNKKFQGKDKGQVKSHIALAWYNGELYTTTPKGELLSWKLWQSGGKHTLIHHLHYRAIYTLVVVGDVIISSSQDRFMQGYCLRDSEHLFQYPTLGASASTLAFCPQDSNRLAIGSQENVIRFINFEGSVPMQCSAVWQNVKGKILSIAWHPEHEGRLLFGTASGQVGWVEMSNSRVTTCAYYHQKSVYKVEWAPLICPEKIGLKDSWCAYSFGDREIVVRSSSDAMADPVQLLPLLIEPQGNKPLKDVTEFSFSCDYKFISIGTNDGEVRIYTTSELKLVLTLHMFRKAIQHVLWQPPPTAAPSYVVAVSSNEQKVCICNLSAHLEKATSNAEVITQATRELCGHESRVVWLAWSPHKPELLASASYDHTIQLWDTSTGQPLVNYGGHKNRAFRVEFSPTDPDLLYSFAEENCVHSWRPSQLTCKTTAESAAKAKESNRLKRPKDKGGVEDPSEKVVAPSDASENKVATAAAVSEKTVATSSSLMAANKKAVFKSFFPKLHAITSRKKSFFNIITLNLLAMWKENSKESSSVEKEIEEDLTDDLEDSNDDGQRNQDLASFDIETICNKYQYLLEKEVEIPSREEFAYALNIYGKPNNMDEVLNSEISEHKTRGHDIQADLMHCWQGSLNEHIRSAARQKKLNPFLVSAAPQVSIKLWEFANEAYAKQLIEEGDIISAATYLVNIDQVEEAVSILMKHKYFREALAIAKCRRGFSEELLQKITSAWVASTIYEGNYSFAAAILVSHGQIEEAASALSRRNDHCSLFVSSVLYDHAGKKDLSKSIGLMAFREACLRQEHEKIDLFLLDLPELQWYRVISRCHGLMSKLLQDVGNGSGLCYMVSKRQVTTINGTSETGDSPDDSCTRVDESREELPLLHYMKGELESMGISKEDYSHIYNTIAISMSTQQMPTSVKQLWFFVAVEMSQMLLSPTPESLEHHLSTALLYALSWGKANQIYHLSRILLPKGPSDPTTVVPVTMDCLCESSEALSKVKLLYHVAELHLIHSELQSDDAWNELAKGVKSSNDSAQLVSEGQGDAPADSSGKEFDVPKVSDLGSNGQDNVTGEGRLEDAISKAEVRCESEDGEAKVQETIWKFPNIKTTSDLLDRLIFYADFLLTDTVLDQLKEKFSDGIFEPKEMLVYLGMKLKENGNLKEEDVLLLLSKISFLKS